MSDRNKAVVEYEMELDSIHRALKIEKHDYDPLWEFYDEILLITKTLDERGPLKERKLSNYTGLSEDKITNSNLIKELSAHYGLFEHNDDNELVLGPAFD